MKKLVAVAPGDGIGKEVIPCGVELLEVLNQHFDCNLEFIKKDWGAEKWLSHKVGVTDEEIIDLRQNYKAIYFGALGDNRIPNMDHGREILLKLRFELDLYANFRPVKLYNDILTPLKNKNIKDIDFVIIRENTEDIYNSIGGCFKKNTQYEISLDQSIHSKLGIERIIRCAFNYAKFNNKKKVTLVDKSNAIRFGGDLWQRIFTQVANDFNDIKKEHLFVDTAALLMVRNPEKFEVIVTSNLFGDILSDLAAGLIGGLGISPSASVNQNKIGLFEPVHGSAPDIAGSNKANPIAAFLSAGLLLEFLGYNQAKNVIEQSVTNILSKFRTYDLGGQASTSEMSRLIINEVRGILSGHHS
jgi:3-isopropylmalate dehydrogenase